jgi:hypothetical protein
LRLKNVYFLISYYLSALKTALHLRRWAKNNKAGARWRHRVPPGTAFAIRAAEEKKQKMG